MSNTEKNISLDISVSEVHPQRPEWAKELHDSDDLHCEKDPQNGQNYNAECYVV